MISNWFKHCVVSAVYCVVLASFVLVSSASSATPIQNIVLVHGAFADGSGWQPVYEILVRHGYHVTLVQEPLTSLKEDVAATPHPRPTGRSLCPGRA